METKGEANLQDVREKYGKSQDVEPRGRDEEGSAPYGIHSHSEVGQCDSEESDPTRGGEDEGGVNIELA